MGAAKGEPLMTHLKALLACVPVLTLLLLFPPVLMGADDFMVLRYSDGHTQNIRLERPSESIRQIEFQQRRGSYGRDDRIRVIAATYGRNCGAPHGNATPHLAETCNGRAVCEYVVDHHVLGDPTPGCAKDYVVEWQCGRDPERHTRVIRPEAGGGTRIILRCPSR